RGFCLPAAGGRGAGAIEAGRGAPGQSERRQEMKRLMVVSLSALLVASTAPDAFGWGYHGGFSGGSYHGAYGGSFSRRDGSLGASGFRGGSASGGGGTVSGSGA